MDEQGQARKGSAGPPACNPLCGRCLRSCRQPREAVLLECPRFQPRPFKVATYRFDQLELFGGAG